MEKEESVDNIRDKSVPIIFPLPHGIAGNRSLLSAPSLEPFPPSLPATSTAAHVLRTKVKTVPQRRQRGRERCREQANADVQAKQEPTRQLLCQVLLKSRVPARGGQEVFQCWSPSRSAVPDSSSGEDNREDEVPEAQGVRVRLEIHSPPAEAQPGLVAGPQQGDMGKAAEREGSEGPPGQTWGPGEGASLESLLPGKKPSSRKHDPLTPPPLPLLSISPSSCTTPATLNAPSSSSSSSSSPLPAATSSSSSSSRRWAPPKGFWRVVRPETLLLNGLGPHNAPTPPPVSLRDHVQKTEVPGVPVSAVEPQRRFKLKHSDSLECYLDKYEQKQGEAGGQGRTSSPESLSPLSSSSQSELAASVREWAEAKPLVCGRSKVRQRRSNREEREQDSQESAGHTEADGKGAYESLENDSDSTTLSQEFEPNSSLLFVFPDELPLSPRHEQAKRLLERARLKARCSHTKSDCTQRRTHSDQRGNVKQQDVPANPPPQKQQQHTIQTKEEVSTPPTSGPLLIPEGEQGACSRRYGCSPSRVRFEDESEKEAESRYLDRMRERGRSGNPRKKGKAVPTSVDSAGSGSDRGRGHRSTSTPASQRRQEEVISTGACGVSTTTTTTTVIKKIIVVVKKCEACGSTVREPPSAASDALLPPTPPPPPAAPPAPQQQPASSAEEVRGKGVPRPGPQGKQEASTRPKQPLSVTFAGAFVLGENKERGSGWRNSGFGKLRRRSLKGQSRLESGHGPYGPSWAQRRNSNPRNRTQADRAPGSPVDLEHCICKAPEGPREPSRPPLPIKSALKPSSKNRTLAGQCSVQSQDAANQVSAEGCGFQHADLLESPDTWREGPLTQGTPTTVSLVPCIRPSSLRYSSARLTPDLPPAELWDATPDGPGLSLSGDPGCEGRPSPRSLALSRAEDLRAELLRAEHLKAEAQWEDIVDTPRKATAERDGRAKLSLRRFLSSIGLNGVGKLVKGSRSSSMEQLTSPTSPSPTRRPQPPVRIQRTPSLQSLHTVLPLAQLRKASSVQSLERRTERSILGEVQIPYGLAPSPVSPQVELRGGLSTDDVPVTSRMVRPIGKVTQAFPDGTLLLELTRSPNEPFGFLISRGKGRANTGVYIEQVGISGGDGPYAGLLGVGDEILRVNGEPVAGLTLDQVTRLMTRGESTACLRIMPCRRGPPLKPKPPAGHVL